MLNILKSIPSLPGCYQYYNKNNEIIYVGKAKDLHKRVNSYFNKVQTGKTKKLVSEISDIKYIITSSELEAFIVEINLIKKYNPKYNILLKDDKSYPYIEYINKPYPSLKVSRYLNIKRKDNKILFGPFPNAFVAKKIVEILNRLYPLKKCINMPKKVCLYYHINECLGYCENKHTDYVNKMEEEILSFLKGNDKIVKEKIYEKINYYSETLNYEYALELKKDLEYIDKYMEKQQVELHDFKDKDIWNVYYDNEYVSICILFIRNNKLLNIYNDLIKYKIDIKSELEEYIASYYIRHEKPSEIILPSLIEDELLSKVINKKVIISKKGIKMKLLDMAYINSKDYYDTNIEKVLKEDNKNINNNLELSKILNTSINHIEIFDNSNLFGTFTVSGMVVFKKGVKSTKDYRKYKMDINKNDDYLLMREVIKRRYSDKKDLPDLIIVDGGKGQISATRDELNRLNLSIKVCGLVKNDKHSTSGLMLDDYTVVNIDKSSSLFHYLTNMQNEVHRFTINYHKQIRSKGLIASTLDNVSGIGKERRNKLIKKYGTINKIKEASIDELTKIIPLDVAKNLKEYLSTKSDK